MIFRFPQPGAAAAAGWWLAAADAANAASAVQCSCRRRRRSGMGRIAIMTPVPGVGVDAPLLLRKFYLLRI